RFFAQQHDDVIGHLRVTRRRYWKDLCLLLPQGTTELGEILTVGDDRELVQRVTAAARDLPFQLGAMFEHVLARGRGGVPGGHGARTTASATQTQQSQHARKSP